MARKHVINPDNTQELWATDMGDDGLGRYYRWNAELEEVEARALTDDERNLLNPGPAVLSLTAAVDQLILDSLMGGM